jgi:copper chaperone NosL
MIISEERHAAGLSGDAPLVFDDTGEMIAVIQEQGLGDRHAWVHDYETKAWIDGAAASYVILSDGRTPMGTGVVAFKERAAADTFVTQNAGRVMTWAEIQTNWTIG